MPRTHVAGPLLVLLVLAGWTLAGAPGAEKPKKPKNPHWSDALKSIPVGPLSLDIGGSVRLRYEYQNDFNIQRYADETRSGFRKDHFLLQRLRLNFDLHFDEDAHLFAQLQDARAHGSNFRRDDFASGCPYWNPMDLRQAYLEWRHIGGSPFGLKVGRQAIFYADNRIWGPGEWGNVGRYTWDAVKLIADTDFATVDLLFANRVAYAPHSFDEHNHRLDAFGAYATIKKLPCKLDLFWVGKRTRPDMVVNAKGDTVALDTHTVGFHVDGKFGAGKRWDYRATLAHTFGDSEQTTSKLVKGKKGAKPKLVVTTSEDDVAAWGGNARIGYTFDHPWEPRLGVEYSFATGDPNEAGGDYETFDGVFGAIDRMYGRIDFFSWMNLQDYQASFSCRPIEKTKVMLDYHFFRLDEDKDGWYWCNGRPARSDPSGKAGSGLGQEIDILLSYKHSDHLSFLAGYAHFFPGGFVKHTGPDPDADWFFFQTLYKL